jgi:plastocyanin
MKRRELLAGAAATALPLTAGCFGIGSGPEVVIANENFTPVRVTISPGTTVTWSVGDVNNHSLQSATFTESATEWEFFETLEPGDTATRTFDEEGIYQYYCNTDSRNSECGAILVGDVSLAEDVLPCESTGGEF